MKKIVRFSVLLGVCFCTFAFFGNNVSALSGSVEDFMKISLLDGLKTCYKKGDNFVKSSGIKLQDFNDFGVNAIWGSAFWGSDASSDGIIRVPTMVGNTLNDSDVSCKETMNGYDGWGGKITGLKGIYNESKDPAFYGYVTDDEENAKLSGNGSFAQVKITLGVKDKDSNAAKTNSVGELICDAHSGYHDGWFSKYHYWKFEKCAGTIRLEYSKDKEKYLVLEGGEPVLQNIYAGTYKVGEYGESYSIIANQAERLAAYNQAGLIEVDSAKVGFKKALENSSFVNLIKDDMKNVFGKVYPDPQPTVSIEEISAKTINDGTNVNSYFKFADGDADLASDIAVSNLVGSTSERYLIKGKKFLPGGKEYNIANAFWHPSYIYHLYYKYLTNIMQDDDYKDHVFIGKCEAKKPSVKYAFKNAASSWCQINVDTTGEGALSETLSVVGSGGSLVAGNFGDVLDWFNKEDNYKYFENDDYLNAEVTDSDDNTGIVGGVDSGEPDSPEPTCMGEAGTTLGWILCPVMDMLAGAVEWAYNDMVKPALEVDPQLFTGRGDPTFDAWGKFRDIANILFVLFLLAVIFSQLTGYGIDNYGIKKTLPKLIVAAFLMNLSYFICVALVDVSNILGNSLQNFFTGMAVGGVPTEIEGIPLSQVGTGILTFVGVLASFVGAIGLAIIASGGGVAFLMGLLISGLGVIVSILFLFLLLAAREAAIVVLVVLSPLAWACFILPNTKNLFDKWWKLGWKLLMVYPIAGVLIGGGDYVSRLLLAAGAGHDGFFSAFAAMVVGIVPILAIPTVLKSSFAMMGNLGAKLSGMGKNLGGRLTGNADKAWKGSEGYKSRQDTFARNRQARSAERTQRRLNRRIDNGRTLSRGQQERLARANEAILERDKRNAENRVRATAGYVDAVRAKQELDIEQSAQDTLLYGNGDYVNAQRTKAENARTAGMAEAEVGVLGINQELARQRAMSSRKAQEMKNYSDQYSALGRSEMGAALSSAASAYNADRNERTAMQLAAAVSVANAAGMNKEALGSLGGLRLSAKNANDAMVLNQMAASDNKVLSQFAKSRSKNDTTDGAVGMSVDEFITSGTSGDSLTSSFAAKGSEVANGMDDDTLGYLNLHGGAGALSTESLVNAANATSNQKEIDEINKMLATRTDYSMRTRDLDKLKLSTLDKLGTNDTLYREAVNEIRANMDSPEVQRILNGMDRDVRTRLGLS